MTTLAWQSRPLSPFGLEVTAAAKTTTLAEIDAGTLKRWIDAHRYVLLRGFAPLSTDSMMRLARTLGEPLEWEFGAVNELVAKPDAKNYIYTTAAVPFHWDGAFVGKIPHFILFSCEVAPPENSGGETIFCDGSILLKNASPRQTALWNSTSVKYSCDRVVHYGGSFTSPMIVNHPENGSPTLRFAEPVHDLNPVTLEMEGMPPEQQEKLIAEMAQLLRKPEVCVAHAWRAGDVLIADNFALLHGRNAFIHSALRHIRRINIL
ncbi:MAG TPA: TauD/TfdA family dioxygenase [Candidatus Acidoferrum sp.]|nr:TauD/TfdA family dioxygenase [Candidatus Acidoferrum sp.]